MKTAIVITGNIRTWNECKDNFIKSFGHLNADIFASTYDLQYEYHPAQKRWMGGSPDVYLSFEEITNMLDGINLIGLDYEKINDARNDYHQFKSKLHPVFQNDSGNYFQYRKLKRVVDMVTLNETKNQIKYDNIIKLRFDIHYNIFNYDITQNIVIISTGETYPNDVMFATTRDNFIKLTEFYINEIQTPIYSDSHLHPPHNLFLRGFNYCNLNIHEENITEYIVRKTGKQYWNR